MTTRWNLLQHAQRAGAVMVTAVAVGIGSINGVAIAAAPSPVSDVQARQAGSAVEVSWTLPDDTTGIEGLTVWESAGADDVAPGAEGSHSVGTVAADQLATTHSVQVPGLDAGVHSFAVVTSNTTDGLDSAPVRDLATVVTPSSLVPTTDVATATSVPLTWTAVPGAVGYQVSVFADSAPGGALLPETTALSTSRVGDTATGTTISGLTPSTSYAFEVFALSDDPAAPDLDGFAAAEAAYGRTAPAAPTGLSVQQRGNLGVVASWTGPSGDSTSYYLTGKAGSTAPATLDAATDVSYTPTPGASLYPTDAGAYSVSVFTNDGWGNSAPTSATITLLGGTAPTVSTSKVTDTTMRVTWTNDVPGATGYRVYAMPADTASEPEHVLAGGKAVSGTGSTLSTDLTGLTPGVGYQVYVFPVTADGWGQPGSDYPYTLHTGASSLTATAKSAGTVALAWAYTGSNPSSWFVVRRSSSAPTSSSCSGCEMVATVAGTSRGVTDDSLQTSDYGKTWHYAVFGEFDDGESVARSATTVPWSAALLKVSHPYGTASYASSAYRVRIQWDAPDLTGVSTAARWTTLKVYQAKGSTPPSTSGTPAYTCERVANTSTTTPTCGTSRTFTGLTNGAEYTWVFVLSDAAGHSGTVTFRYTARRPGLMMDGSLTGGEDPFFYTNLSSVYDSNGNQYIAYNPFGSGEGVGPIQIGKRKAGASTWSFSGINGPSGQDHLVQLAMLSDDTLVVAFNRKGSPVIETRKAGGSWSTASKIAGLSSVTSSSSYTSWSVTDIVRDGSDKLHVLLSKETASSSSLYYSSRADGGAWKAAVKVPGAVAAYDAQLAYAGGVVHMAYTYFGTSGSAGVYKESKTPGQANFSTPTKLAGTTGEYLGALVAKGSRVQLFTQRYPVTAPPAAADGIYVAKGSASSSTGNTTWGDRARVHGTTKYDNVESAGVGKDGQVTVALTRVEGSASPGLYQVTSSDSGSFANATASAITTKDYDSNALVSYNGNSLHVIWCRQP